MKIFLDMDGVITDFVLPAMKLFDAGVSEIEYPCSCEWDILSAINMVRNERGLTPIGKKHFWDNLIYDFWRNLKMYPGIMQFIDQLKQYGEVFIATSPTLDSGCVAAKYDWIMGNLPDFRSKLFICTRKELLAGPGAVLIDDRDKNCDAFDKAGGYGILVNRPWNNGGYDPDPYKGVLNEVDRIYRQRLCCRVGSYGIRNC